MIRRAVKQRRESIEQYRKGGRAGPGRAERKRSCGSSRPISRRGWRGGAGADDPGHHRGERVLRAEGRRARDEGAHGAPQGPRGRQARAGARPFPVSREPERPRARAEETEVKLPCPDLARVREKLRERGATSAGREARGAQRPLRRSARRAVRARLHAAPADGAAGRTILTFKGPARFDGGMKVAGRAGSWVSDAGEAAALLAGLGLARVPVRKAAGGVGLRRLRRLAGRNADRPFPRGRGKPGGHPASLTDPGPRLQRGDPLLVSEPLCAAPAARIRPLPPDMVFGDREE